jgi:hypothetical protein
VRLGLDPGSEDSMGVAQSALWPFWVSNFIHEDGLIGSCTCFHGLRTEVLGEVELDRRGWMG